MVGESGGNGGGKPPPTGTKSPLRLVVSNDKPEPRPTGPMPWSQSAETEIIGVGLASPVEVLEVADWLLPEHFFARRNQVVWAAIVHLARAGSSTDAGAVLLRIEAQGDADAIDHNALNEYSLTVGSARGIGYYADVIYAEYARRELISTAHEVIAQAHDKSVVVDEFLANATQLIASVETAHAKREPESFDVLSQLIEEMSGGAQVLWSQPTGIGPLDEWCGGIEQGQTWVVMADPGKGKTNFAFINCSLHATGVRFQRRGERWEPYMVENEDERGGVVYFSCEMGQRRLLKRAVSSLSGVSPRAFKKGDLTPGQTERAFNAVEVLGNSAIAIHRMKSVEAMLGRVRRYHQLGVPFGPPDANGQRRRRPLRLVVFDYIQRIGQTATQKTTVETITHGMHRIQEAMSDDDMHLPCLVLSQPETGARRAKTTLTNTGAQAKGSGAIEEDADCFIIIEKGEKDEDTGMCPGGLRVTKMRDDDPMHWPALPLMDSKGVKVLKDACGWKWIGPRLVVL